MLNFIWPFFLIVSFIYAFFSGRIAEVNNSIFDSTKSAVELGLSLLGTTCLWCGIMKVAENTKIVGYINNLLNPIMKWLFPNIKKEDKEYKEITMNMTANIMGLGNAATPLGLKAIKTMQNKNNNKNRLTNSMSMFIIINTASIQIIPTTVMAIRSSLASQNPSKIILPVWGATILAFLSATLSAKLFMKKF